MNLASDLREDLRTLPCLSGLKEDELSAISEQAHLKKFSRNQFLFRESEPVDFFFIVKKGRIKLFKTSEKGKELIIKIMGPSDYFCCAPIYSDKRYSVSAVPIEDTEAVVIPVRDFMEMIDATVGEMGMRIIKGLCGRIKYFSNLVENISFKDVEHRVLRTLLRVAEEESCEDEIVSLAVTHQDIAAMTGTAREVVSRTMSKLKREGIIIDSNIKVSR